MAFTSKILLLTTFLLYLTVSTYSNGLSQANNNNNNLASQVDNNVKADGDHQAPGISVPSTREKRIAKATGSELSSLRTSKKKYCVPKPKVSERILKGNIDWGCKMGVDCDPLVNTKEVSCSDKSLWIKAAYVMNYFFNANGRNESSCDFNKTGFLTLTNPSDGKCAFI